MKETIKEVIVVEGRDDETAVKQAVYAEIIITRGFGINDKIFKKIKFAKEKCGVIILTDPDHAGEQIRDRIDKAVPGCKHAYIPRDEAILKDNIGVENASSKSIVDALKKSKAQSEIIVERFKQSDLSTSGLILAQGASERRDKVGKILGIGYGNAKTFLKRLNKYGITVEEFEEAIRQIGEV